MQELPVPYLHITICSARRVTDAYVVRTSKEEMYENLRLHIAADRGSRLKILNTHKGHLNGVAVDFEDYEESVDERLIAGTDKVLKKLAELGYRGKTIEEVKQILKAVS